MIRTLVASGIMAVAAATGAAAATPAPVPALPQGCTQQVEVMPAGSPFESYAQGTVDPGTAGSTVPRGWEYGVSCPSVVNLKHGTTVTFGPDTTTAIKNVSSVIYDQPTDASFKDGALTLFGGVGAGMVQLPGSETIHSDGSLQFDVNGYHLTQAANGTPSATQDKGGSLPVRMSPDGAFVVGGTTPDVSMLFKPWIVQSDYR